MMTLPAVVATAQVVASHRLVDGRIGASGSGSAGSIGVEGRGLPDLQVVQVDAAVGPHDQLVAAGGVATLGSREEQRLPWATTLQWTRRGGVRVAGQLLHQREGHSTCKLHGPILARVQFLQGRCQRRSWRRPWGVRRDGLALRGLMDNIGLLLVGLPRRPGLPLVLVGSAAAGIRTVPGQVGQVQHRLAGRDPDALCVAPCYGEQLEVQGQHDGAGQEEGHQAGADGVDGTEIQCALQHV